MIRSQLMVCALLLGCLGAGGCQVVGALAAVVGGEPVRAEHRLDDRPTLIMVEDPDEVLGDPTMAGVVARSIENQLDRRRVPRSREFIDAAALRALANELGDEYDHTPIDRVGRLVGAEQVIHVKVTNAYLARDLGVYEPTAEAYVRVIDAVESRRVFPDDNSSGRSVTAKVALTATGDDSEADPGMQVAMTRQLAETLGRDVARLFHRWNRAEDDRVRRVGS